MLPWSPARQALVWLRDPYGFFLEARRRLGGIFRVTLPALGEAVIVGQPEAVRQILALSPEAAHAGAANVVFRSLLGASSLFRLDGPQHHRHRRLVMPALHGDRMRFYGPAMLDLSDEVVDQMPLRRRFSLHEPIHELTLGIILRTVFGLAEGERFRHLSKLLLRGLDVVAWPPLLFPAMQVDLGPWSPWGRYVRVIAELDRTLREEIRAARRRGVEGREDFLATLLQARDDLGNPLDEQEMIDELITMLSAGHETSATALLWALRWVLGDPGLLARVQEEARALGRSPEAIERSGLLDGVVHEALRLNPVISLFSRILQEPLELGGYRLPKGTRVAPSVLLIHRDETLYPEPDRFRPERYRQGRPPAWAYLPFGGGARRCVGAAFSIYEMKMVLATIFRRTSLALAAGYRPAIARRFITLAPSEGLPVVLSGRRAR
jgi:cytochrome P450